MREWIRGWIKDIVIGIVIICVVVIFISPIVVKKSSMNPNLTDGDYILLSKQTYKFRQPKRGDIVVFPVNKDGKKEAYIKRVIGLPGEKVDVVDDSVYINKKKLEEDYTAEGITPGLVMDFKVPKGRLFVMGDNRSYSLDSRNKDVGTIPIDSVKGVAIFRVFPFGKFGLLQ